MSINAAFRAGESEAGTSPSVVKQETSYQLNWKRSWFIATIVSQRGQKPMAKLTRQCDSQGNLFFTSEEYSLFEWSKEQFPNQELRKPYRQ